jgi:AcrR family transcriptional regulator
MSSQKSTAASTTALEPKRQRGRLRVAAILDAGAAVFAEKGYDAATMTEIAARSNTAIGSLYRFFPTKEVLADALLAWYAALIGGALDEIARRAARLSPSGLADALVDLMLDLRSERAAAIALVEVLSDAADKRRMLRGTMRRQIATILMTASGGLPRAKAEAMAVLLLHVLKAVPGFAQEKAGTRARLVGEARELARLYIADAFGKPAGRRPGG